MLTQTINRTTLRLAIVGLLLATTTGCTTIQRWKDRGYKVGPNYCRPVTSTNVEWIDVQSAPELTTADPDIASWWEIFNDPILNEMIETTYRDNLSLKQACSRIEQATAIRDIKTGSLFPQVQQLIGNYQALDNSRNVAIPAPVEQFDQFGLGATAAWELDIWGRFRRSVDAADANLEASINSYDDISVLLFSSVALTYTEIRTLQKRIELTKANLDNQKGSLKLAETRYKAKQSNKLDVLRGQNNLRFTSAAIPALEAQLRIANNRLCVLLGYPPTDLVSELPSSDIPFAQPIIDVGIPAELLRRRPDIRRSERLLKAQSEQIGITEAELYPKIALVGNFQFQAEDFNHLLSSNSIFSSIGPSFNWNVLNYGRIRNAVKAEKAKFKEFAFRYQDNVLKAQQEVEDAIAAYLSAKKRTNELRAAVGDVTEASDIAVSLYRAGSIDFGEVFLLQSVQLSQQDQLVASRANETLSLIKLYKALGGGWQYRLGHRSAARPQFELEPDSEPLDEELEEESAETDTDKEKEKDAEKEKDDNPEPKADDSDRPDDGEEPPRPDDGNPPDRNPLDRNPLDDKNRRPALDEQDSTIKDALKSIQDAVEKVERESSNLPLSRPFRVPDGD